ncbi:hypothetical protein DICSQDRAFT_175185 [Dichomitus squalens LYAD-421 SS1]|uniref:Uncharacterized protein n=1 Tax=Dichomitus squalens (strain LYAD-421) TaxID=732165 RepID=R7SM85_DICSQ|nr:uncharacterized protein DICSQDRAFT_175185 [Dichomitus squalens LYAD-421 SS1]EJF56127.1 hypothetical protein DICSQDRAFT_175185 [Dichomitus squalens LYAD-421 SS1]
MFRARNNPSVTFVAQSYDPSNTLLGRPGTRIIARGFRHFKFPPNTAGFLYYHIPPYSPPLAGEVRFRVTFSPDPASFTQGYDLLMDYGVRWNIPLLYMTDKKEYTGLHTLLLQDGLVTPQLSDIAASAVEGLKKTAHGRKISFRRTALVSSFRRGFHFRVGQHNRYCIAIGTDTVVKKRVENLANFRVPVDGIGESAQYSPFEGSTLGPRSPFDYLTMHGRPQALRSAALSLRLFLNMLGNASWYSGYCVSSTVTPSDQCRLPTNTSTHCRR